MNYNATRTYTEISCGQHRHRVYVDSRGRYFAEAVTHHPTIDVDVEKPTRIAITGPSGSRAR